MKETALRNYVFGALVGLLGMIGTAQAHWGDPGAIELGYTYLDESEVQALNEDLYEACYGDPECAQFYMYNRWLHFQSVYMNQLGWIRDNCNVTWAWQAAGIGGTCTSQAHGAGHSYGNKFWLELGMGWW